MTQLRSELAPAPERLQYHRIVVKAGTSVLTHGTERLSMETLSDLACQISLLSRWGASAALVTSGAIAAGREVLAQQRDLKEIPFRQVLAAIGQGRLMHTYERLFANHGITVAQALLTWNDLSDRQRYLNVRGTILSLWELGVVPIINENDVVAVDEIGVNFGDNDRLSALIANLVDADLLVTLTDIDGLYTADPREDPKATLVRRVAKVDSRIRALAGSRRNSHARGGMPTKLEAAKLVTTSGIPMVMCYGHTEDAVLRVACGEELGTFFAPAASRLEGRKRWMLSGLGIRGEVMVDKGAMDALIQQGRSLLPAGIQRVKGDFRRGDVVYVLRPDGQRAACGISNYGVKDVERIKGHHSDQIHEILGYDYGQEVIHRNNMVLL